MQDNTDLEVVYHDTISAVNKLLPVITSFPHFLKNGDYEVRNYTDSKLYRSNRLAVYFPSSTITKVIPHEE